MKRNPLFSVIIVLFMAPVLFTGCTTAKPVASQAAGKFINPAVIDINKVLPPPPAQGSLGARADIETVVMVQAWRTPEQAAYAKKADSEDLFDFSEVLGPWFKAENFPRSAVFFKDVMLDVREVSNRVKKLHMRARPPLSDKAVKPCVDIPKSSSYPSGHSTRAFAAALVLSEIFPAKREALLRHAHMAAWSRIIGGVHFPTDDIGGRLLAEAIFAELMKSPGFRAGVEACRREADPVQPGINDRK